MAFRKRDRPIYVANIHYYGDVDAMDKAPEDLEIRAWVDAPEPQELIPDEIPGSINALVALIPPLAPYHLFMNATASTAALYPAVELLRDASNQLLKGEKSARSYRAEGKPITVGGPPDFVDAETAAIPSTIPESEGKSTRIQEFALMERPKTGDIWSRSRAPEIGGSAFFANAGLMLLIQHVAHNYDYEETVVPIGAGLGAFVGQFDAYEQQLKEDRGDEVDEDDWAAYGENILTLGWADRIASVIYSDDPRQALAQLSRG